MRVDRYSIGSDMTASPQPFHDANARAGQASTDAGTDPWGVRRAENLLTSLEGVLSARVVTTPLGEVSEIHILATSAQTPKQVVRNVESALLAHLGLKVDHRKISVALMSARRTPSASAFAWSTSMCSCGVSSRPLGRTCASSG